VSGYAFRRIFPVRQGPGRTRGFELIGRTAGESAFNLARMMRHARNTPADSVYAHTMQSDMASVAENVPARALGLKP